MLNNTGEVRELYFTQNIISCCDGNGSRPAFIGVHEELIEAGADVNACQEYTAVGTMEMSEQSSLRSWSCPLTKQGTNLNHTHAHTHTHTHTSSDLLWSWHHPFRSPVRELWNISASPSWEANFSENGKDTTKYPDNKTCMKKIKRTIAKHTGCQERQISLGKGGIDHKYLVPARFPQASAF